MPRSYFQWAIEDMENAVRAVRNDKITIYEACKRFKVPKTTLKRRLINSAPHKPGQKPALPPALPPALEQTLVEHIDNSANVGLGLSAKKIRSLAFQLVQKRKIKNYFNKDKLSASWKWYSKFAKRNRLTVRKAQNLSRECAKVTPETISNFMKTTEALYRRCGFVCGIHEVRVCKCFSNRVFNVDETGLKLVRSATSVVFKIGKKHVYRLGVAEKGPTVTTIACCSAAGQLFPPFCIFKETKNYDIYEAPAGTKCC